MGASLPNDWAVIVKVFFCTVGTFGINWYYKRKEREDRLNACHRHYEIT
ncbi:hypothetical protein KCP70_03325 [Salmonella enterica subsp. enterica]|nr:hypothetical protein KCP70_03325 [Salmonella enterica subsp. enterica]